jgi:transposase
MAQDCTRDCRMGCGTDKEQLSFRPVQSHQGAARFKESNHRSRCVDAHRSVAHASQWRGICRPRCRLFYPARHAKHRQAIAKAPYGSRLPSAACFFVITASYQNGAMNKKVTKFSPEVRARAVRLVREQRSEHPSMWAAVESIAPMISCTPQTLHEWVKRDQVDHGERDGVTKDERERLKALEREVKELRRANEILKVASAFFAQAELDRRFKS